MMSSIVPSLSPCGLHTGVPSTMLAEITRPLALSPSFAILSPPIRLPFGSMQHGNVEDSGRVAWRTGPRSRLGSGRLRCLRRCERLRLQRCRPRELLLVSGKQPAMSTNAQGDVGEINNAEHDQRRPGDADEKTGQNAYP